MLNKQPRWDLKSRWTLRQQRRPPQAKTDCLGFLFEHEVTVSSPVSGVELVARFVHALPQARASPRPFTRGGLVSLVVRRRSPQQQHQHRVKRLDAKAYDRRIQPRLKAIFDVSPQSRATISGSPSPVAAPLALSASSGIVPIVPVASESIKEDIGAAPALPSPAAILPEQNCADVNVAPCLAELPADANAAQTLSWLRARRFHAFEATFASFSAADILRLSRDDLIQICGLADGIRLFNALHAKAPQPKLSLYFAVEAGLWRAVYLESLTAGALTRKLLEVLALPADRLHAVLLLGPQGIHVLVTNELIANMKDESMFVVETIKEPGTDRYKLLLKPSTH